MKANILQSRQALTCVLFTTLFSGFASAADFIVSDVGSLKVALDSASTNGEDDTIDLDGGLYTLIEPLKILAEDNTLKIFNGTLVGNGATRLVEINRVPNTFYKPDAEEGTDNSVTFDNVTFQNGFADQTGELNNSTGGAAILGNWSLQILNSTFTDNIVAGNGQGGAIRSEGPLAVFDSVFEGNKAALGGAIIVRGDDSVLLRNSFINNDADNGGALNFRSGPSTRSIVGESFFKGNTASDFGGAIWSRKAGLIVRNSTLYQNIAGIRGGGIYSQSNASDTAFGVELRFSALIENSADGSNGGGIGAFSTSSIGMKLTSTLLGGNAGGNCWTNVGTTGSFQTTISDDSSCVGTDAGVIFDEVTGVNGVLASIEPQDNGGPTLTFALKAGSIAVDGSVDGDCELNDQRGVLRPSAGSAADKAIVGDICDIGPFEFQKPVVDADIRDVVASAAENLDAAIDGASDLQAEILTEAAEKLISALEDSNWISDNELEDNGGAQVFNNIMVALKQIALITDSDDIDPTLEAALNAVSDDLLDSLRKLAENRIEATVSDSGRSDKIDQAMDALVQGDADRVWGLVESAAKEYRKAWSLAKAAD